MTQEEIARLIATELGLSDDVDAATLGYGEVPEWTSATHMNVIIALEEQLGTEFSPDEIVAATTPAKIVAILSARAEARPDA